MNVPVHNSLFTHDLNISFLGEFGLFHFLETNIKTQNHFILLVVVLVLPF